MVATAWVVGAEFDAQLYSPLGLLWTVLLVHAWSPGPLAAEWNGPSWSLSAEWFAYLIFPAFAWLGLWLRHRPLPLLALTGAGFVGLDLVCQALFGDVLVHAETRMGALRIIPEFFYGMALYRLGERYTPAARLTGGLAIAAAVLVLLLMHVQADDRIVVTATGPLVLALAWLSKTRADSALAQPWMLAAGEASYALYLVHMPILIGWKGVHAALTDRPSSYVFAWWEIPPLLTLTLVTAFGLHYLLERPARRWIRRQSDRVWAPLPVTVKLGSQTPDAET